MDTKSCLVIGLQDNLPPWYSSLGQYQIQGLFLAMTEKKFKNQDTLKTVISHHLKTEESKYNKYT